MENTQLNKGSSVSHSIENTSPSTSEPTYTEKVKKAASDASSQVSRLANDASEQVSTAYDSATSAVGQRLVSTGSKLESTDVVQRTGRKMGDVGNYLNQAKFEDLSEVARASVRKNPLAAVAIGVGAGVLIGRWIAK